jgi:hypothetical protein
MNDSVAIDRKDLLETLRDIQAASEAGDKRTVSLRCEALIEDYGLRGAFSVDRCEFEPGDEPEDDPDRAYDTRFDESAGTATIHAIGGWRRG